MDYDTWRATHYRVNAHAKQSQQNRSNQASIASAKNTTHNRMVDEKSHQARLDRQSREDIENRKINAKEKEAEEKKRIDLAKIQGQSEVAQINRLKELELRKVDLLQSRQEHEQGLENKEVDFSATYQLNKQSFRQKLISDWLEAGYDYKKAEMLANKDLQKVNIQELSKQKIAGMEIDHKKWEVGEHIKKDIKLQGMEYSHLENIQKNKYKHEINTLNIQHHNKMQELNSIHCHEQTMEYERRETSSLLAKLEAWVYDQKTKIDERKAEKETMLNVYEKVIGAELEVYVYEEKAKIDEKRGFPKQEEIEGIFSKKWKFWDK